MVLKSKFTEKDYMGTYDPMLAELAAEGGGFKPDEIAAKNIEIEQRAVELRSQGVENA